MSLNQSIASTRYCNGAFSAYSPRIEEFLDSGEGTISLGAVNHSSLRHTAIASDEHNMLVALVRSRGETLHQLLDRLDQALGPALEDDIYVDEINGP